MRTCLSTHGVGTGGYGVVVLGADGARERAARVLIGLEAVEHRAEVVAGRPAELGTCPSVEAMILVDELAQVLAFWAGSDDVIGVSGSQ